MFGPAGERRGKDQEEQGRADELQGRVPSTPCGESGANQRAAE